MTKTKKGAPPNNGAAPADATPESLDKVRDILFGGQMRAVESRLQGLESRLLRGQDALRADFNKQLSGLSADLKEALRVLEKRHLKLEESSGLADADLREGILQHSKAVTAEIARVSERLTAELNRSAQELKADKLSITSLAGLFGDAASKLAAEAKGSGKSAPKG